jgi:sugar phosphate isomerase/epimerase
MKPGIFAKTFDGTGAATVLAAVRAAGFDAAQFNMACLGLAAMPDAIDPGLARGVATAAAASGVEIVAVSGTYNMIHPDPSRRADGLRRLAVLAGAAAALGTGLVTLCTGTRDPEDQWRHHPDNDTPEAWRDLLIEMEKAVAIAEIHGIDLGIEPELANAVSSAARARRLIDEIGSRSLRIVLDPANLVETATPDQRRRVIAEAVDLLADRITLAHAKDRAADGGFVACGRGVIDFADFIRRLKATGFDGPVVTHGLSAAEAPAVAEFLRQWL